MNKLKILSGLLTVLTVIAAGCSKPSNTNTKAASNANVAPTAKAEEKIAVPAAKVVPVPENWIAMVDEAKGYGFKVPEGTHRDTQNADGIDVFVAKTPEPSSVGVFVMAF